MSRRLKQHYYILGLDPNASEEDVKQRYRALALETHPDRNRGSEERAKLLLKPLPLAPASCASDQRTSRLLSPSTVPLPDSPTLTSSPGPITRPTSRRRPMHLAATWQPYPRTDEPSTQTPLLGSPMPPPVPLKIRSKSAPRTEPEPPKTPKLPRSPRRSATIAKPAKNSTIPHREPLSPSFAGVTKQRVPHQRSIHDVRASIFTILSSLQNIASSTTKNANDDAMYGTLQRLKRRMLNGRHRKIVQTETDAVQHWVALEQSLLRVQRRCYEVDVKRKIDARRNGRRAEIVGMLNAWEQEVRSSWTNNW